MIDLKITSEKFFDQYFEKNFLLIKKGLGTLNFSWSDVNELLYIIDPKSPNIRLFNEGLVDEALYVEEFLELGMPRRRIIKDVFYRLMSEGGTLVMNRLEFVSSKVRQLCMAVSDLCGQHTIANGYIARNGTGSFGKHWDTHDVFAIQLFGRKHWRLYKPTFELPTRSQTSKHVKEFCPETPVFDEILEAGDILYIPRGWWHEVSPIGEETFHLAIGTHGANMIDYVTWCCNKYLIDRPECRKGIRFDNSESNNLTDVAAIVAEVITNPRMLEEFQRATIASEKLSTPFNLELFVDSDKHPIDDDMTIILNSNIRGDAHREYLPTNGSSASRNECSRAILATLATNQRMTINCLAKHLKQYELKDIRSSVIGLVRCNQATICSNYNANIRKV